MNKLTREQSVKDSDDLHRNWMKWAVEANGEFYGPFTDAVTAAEWARRRLKQWKLIRLLSGESI